MEYLADTVAIVRYFLKAEQLNLPILTNDTVIVKSNMIEAIWDL